MQGVIRNTILDIREQIFVGRDSKSGRSAFPFNLKGAASVEVSESTDLSFLSFDLAIASDAGQMASGNHNDTRSKQNDRDLSHVKYAFSVMMQRRRVLDSTFYCTIFIFTASTRTSST
jgi:hypothetical protein